MGTQMATMRRRHLTQTLLGVDGAGGGMVLQVLPMIDALRRAIAIVQGKEVLLQSWPSHQSLCIKPPVVVRSTTDGANG